jgi:hypothetical protein
MDEPTGTRLDGWPKRAGDGQVAQKWAAEKMGVSNHWVRRLLVEMKEKGDGVVVHGFPRGNSEPELSTLPGSGTFYFALTHGCGGWMGRDYRPRR